MGDVKPVTDPAHIWTEGSAAFARYIEHTLLKPDATPSDIERLCEEAVVHGFHSVCVNPYHVPFAVSQLRGTGVKVCTVIGFPLGATTSFAKMCEARDAIAAGAEELDMVINIGALRAGDLAAVEADIEGVVRVAGGAPVKVILETGLLTPAEKVAACKAAQAAGARFVKTSTGFGPGGATVEDVQLMKEATGGALGVKASGGIRDLATAVALIRAGATRLGTSSSVKIMAELNSG